MVNDEHQGWMEQAIKCAKNALLVDEVPIGAVVVKDEKIIGRGWNQNIDKHDPSAHAEIVAMREAGRALQNHRLEGCTVYTTVEPCIMCTAAMVHARVDKIVFGAREPKTGAAGSIVDLTASPLLNHRIDVVAGVKEQQCSGLLKDYFAVKRSQSD